MALKSKNESISGQNLLISQLKKLQGKGFANFIAKQSDDCIKNIFINVVEEIFSDFTPDLDHLPLCVIATEKYANNIISTSSVLEILIAYKDISGFNIKLILKQLSSKLQNSNIKVNIKIYELNEIFNECKNDQKAKAALGRIRYICGSKSMYKIARSEIYRTREFGKEQNMRFYTKIFGAFNEIKTIKQQPDIKNDFGGTNEIYYLNSALNGFDNAFSFKTQALKFIDEKEFSTLNLAIDFILCVKSAQNLSTNSDIFDPNKLSEITNLMQTKSKKTQETDSIISQKLFLCMHTVAIFSRFLISAFYKSKFQSDFTKKQLKLARINGGFYRIQNTIYTPLHKKPQPLSELLLSLSELSDMDYKFDISTIFHIKRAVIEKDEIEMALPSFIKILQKNHSFSTLKALLDAEILPIIVKPLENINHLAEFDGYHKLTVDRHCVLSVKFLENIRDKFIKSLYDDLCNEGRLMMKLVALLHDAGKGLGSEHEIIGSNIFRAYAMKLNLSPKAVNMGVLLVRYHNLMTDVANREDIYSQRTIFSFISKLGDKQALKLLYILTYCVIKATDESLYTAYTQKLLRRLYDLSLGSFDDESLLDEATRRVKKEQSIKRHDEFSQLDSCIKDKIFNISSNLIFAKYSVSELINIAKIAFLCDDINLDIQNNQSLSIKIISNKRLNLSGFLNIMVSFDLGYMEIYELFDEKFFVRLEFNKSAKKDEISELNQKVIIALKSAENLSISKPIITKDEISLDLNHSEEYAKLNINAKDQRGLMAYVMKIFSDFGCKIGSAKIQTIKNRTRNLFLISKDDALCYNYDQILNLLISE